MMKKAVRILRCVHKISGSAIALFFLMWFVTGLVLIYHPYPRLSDRQINDKKELLPSSLPGMDEIRNKVGNNVMQLSVRQSQGQTLAVGKYADGKTFEVVIGDSTEVKPVTFASVCETACRWVDWPVDRVDTLHERGQWVLYSRYDRLMPIYKFCYDDERRHELFISGKTGEVLQLTDRTQRFWSWVGAIPHKLYFSAIRKDVGLWKGLLTIGGALCFIAAASGMLLGLHVLYHSSTKRKILFNPYKKRLYRWHFASGLVFGLFVVTWGLSGIFSMQRIPQWLVDYGGRYSVSSSAFWGRAVLPLDSFKLDYNSLLGKYAAVKEISLESFAGVPSYRLVHSDREVWIDASSENAVRELFLDRDAVKRAVKSFHGDAVPFRMTIMDDYDSYYLSRHQDLPLPVYKVDVDDGYGSRYYVDPRSGHVRYFNDNKMLKKWVFSGLHYFNVEGLVERPLLWTVCIWTLSVGGITVCLTGLMLGLLLLRRKSLSCNARRLNKSARTVR